MRPFSVFVLFFVAAAFLPISAEEADVVAKANERRLETIRYGTDAELGALIEDLSKAKIDDLDPELVKLLDKTKSVKIADAILGYLADGKKKGGEKKTLDLMENRAQEANSNVDSAIRYASAIGLKKAAAQLRDILDAEESRFNVAAARALGSCGSASDAAYLVDYLEKSDPPDPVIAEIIYALGEIRSDKATKYLIGLTESDAKSVRKIAALEALGKIADDAALTDILDALGDDDANVRASALSALAAYKGKKVETAVVSSFRDSYYKVRLAAAKAAAARKIEDAVPFLKYRAERDEVVAVREESIKALGEIGNPQALETLKSLFTEKNTADRLRSAAARALLAASADTYGGDVLAAMEKAKTEKKMPLYHSLAKAVSETKSPALEDAAKAFLASGDIIDKNYGLDLVILNGYSSLKDTIETLADDKNESLARKARKALGR